VTEGNGGRGPGTRARRLIVATALDGPRAGAELKIWPAGQSSGDLGWPRLNQRAALYAEQLLDRPSAPAVSSKSFEVPNVGKLEIRFELAEEAPG